MQRILRILILTLAAASMSTLSLKAQDTQGAKQDMKDAGTSTKNAAKKTGQAIKKTTKKGTHKVARKTSQAAGDVENKTR
jgi:hypothetical protein